MSAEYIQHPVFDHALVDLATGEAVDGVTGERSPRVQYQFVSNGARAAEYYDITAFDTIPHERDGICTSRSCRVELQEQPKFKGFCGPMWGGHMENGEHKFDGSGVITIRYESWDSYETLSR